MTKMLLIPAFQEAERIGAVLAAARHILVDWEIVVVDDGSTDETGRVAREAGAVVIRHPFNLGYGAALQTGYKFAMRRGATLVVQMDGDGQHEAAQIPVLAAPILEGRADLVIGSRFLGVGDYQMEPLRRAGRSLFQGIVGAFGLHITDPTSGFQALGPAVINLYVGDEFPCDYPDVDVLLRAHRSGLRITEEPVAMRGSPRVSTLHGGLRPIYYVYKMLLATWAATARRGD